jgi:hypothetical protein
MSNLSNISGSGFVINGGNNSGSHISNFNTIRGDTFYGVAGNYQTINVCNIQGYTAGSSITISTTALASTYPSITLNSQSNINLITSNSGRVLYNGSEVLTSATNPNWSTVPATQTANLSNYDLSNVSNVRGGATMGLYATNINVNGGLNMLNNTINVSNIASSGNINISNTAPYGLFLTTGSGSFNATTELGITSPRISMTGDTTFFGTNTTINFAFKRRLQTTDIAQPITQYGNGSGTGNNGNITITIPTAYSSSTSYNVFITHTNGTPPNLSVVKNTANQFTIYWTNAGSGTQPFDWMTIGT